MAPTYRGFETNLDPADRRSLIEALKGKTDVALEVGSMKLEITRGGTTLSLTARKEA